MNAYEQLLLDSFKVVCAAAHPDACIQPFIPAPPKGRMIVIGAGKASAAMAAAFERHYPHPVEGVVVTRYGCAVPTQHIKILEAAHPVPDEAALSAVDNIMALLATAGPEDCVVCLISGGGSALLSAPVEGVSFADLQALNTALLKSGAPIQAMNSVRKHVNRALGGGLAKAAAGTTMITLAISDVTGDDPSVIASGATVADPTTLADARAALQQYGITAPASIMQALNNPANETPKPGDETFTGHDYHLIAKPPMALRVAHNFWREQGFSVTTLSTDMEGDTNECAAQHVAYIQDRLAKQDISLPCAVISGGETTVRVLGDGKGGPNTQFMLQAALLLDGRKNIYAMACDTDGIDGSGDNAGALITPETLDKAAHSQVDAKACLDSNDSYRLFRAIDGLVQTGPTYTNVNDYRVFLLLP